MPLAVFPKCYLTALCTTKTMSVKQWIDSSAELDLDGLEFNTGDFTACLQGLSDA